MNGGNVTAWVWGEACEPNDDLGVIYARPDWTRSAACAQAPEVSFFPERGASTAEAKQVCAVCVVRQQCLDYALEEHISHGVWGGLSFRQRKALRRRGGLADAA